MNSSPLRQRTWQIVETALGSDAISRAFDTLVLSLILLSVLSVVMESVQPLGTDYADTFYWFEVFTVTVFTLEYLLRLWSCVSDPRYQGGLWGRLRFVVSPLSIVDLLAILPFYLQFIGLDLRFLRILRLLRIFKAPRYKSSLQLFANAVSSRREELMITSGMMIFLLLIASCLMYYAEHAAQPDKFSDIPSAMWWGVATLTTVGYGDIYPVTVMGRIIGSFVAVLGIGLFALPAGLLGSGFVEEIQKRKRPPKCPHCGKRTDEPNDKS